MSSIRMIAPAHPVVPFRFGGHTALDFVNTVGTWAKPGAKDYIDTFAKWVGWACEVGLLREGQATQIRRNSEKRASGALAEVIAFRRTLFELFGAVIDDRPVARRDLKALNGLMTEGRAMENLSQEGSKFEWVWTGAIDHRAPLRMIALAAGDLLINHDLTRLKRCPGPDGCGWLFLDESRNRSRKWCSMDYCGSFAKARRFAEAHRSRA